jgi:hypothetical protein
LNEAIFFWFPFCWTISTFIRGLQIARALLDWEFNIHIR